jgi:PAS domain S-box-containing protein
MQHPEGIHDGDGLTFDQLAESLPQIVWVARPDGQLTYLSPPWYVYAGTTPEGSLGGNWSLFLHPDDKARAEARWRLALETGDPYDVEFRIRRADGAYRWFLVRANPWRDASGRVARWFGTCTDIEDAKLAREDAARERESLRVTLASIGDAVIVTDADGRITFLNAVAGELTGWGGDAVGRPLAEVFRIAQEETREPIEDPVARVLRLGSVVGLANHTSLFTRDGREIAIDDSAAPIRDAEGRISGAVLVFRDITGRRRAERAAEERARVTAFEAAVGAALTRRHELSEMLQECCARIVEHLDGAFARIWTLSEDGATLELLASAGLYTHLDGPHSRVPVGRFKIGLIAAEGVPHLSNDVPNDPSVGDPEWARRAGMVAFAGYPLKIDDRTVGVMAMFARHRLPEATLDALATMANGVALGIERKRVEEATRASEDRFRSAFEHAAVGMALTDLDGRFLRVNRAFSTISGYDEDELRALDLLSITHADDVPEKVRQLGRLLAGEVPTFVIVKRYVRKGGESVWVQNSVSLVRDGRGAPAKIVALVEDITGRKRAEEESARLLELEQEARARAEAVQAEVEDAGRAKDRFLAMLSHELRTPLTPVLLTATAVLGDPATPEDMRPTWEMIRQNIGLEARLIDDLLDVMRTISGKMPYHFEVIDAHALIRQTLEIVRSDIHEKRLHLESRLEAGRSYVNGDPARLTQAFWNLVKNSVKFTGEGGRITIVTRNEGDSLIVEVSDTGIGIEPAALTKIFNAFEQVEDSVTREFGGLGLGLAITKSVVDSHNGTIEARSEGRDKGATFQVNLMTVAPTNAERAPRGGGFVAERRAFKILLVEDDAMTCRVMATLLRGAGHAITTATSYADALAAASPDFDLVISDVGLPGRSGFDLMRELRARHGLLGIALTGFGQDEDIRKGRDAGFVLHMTKPVDFAKLDEMIQRVGLTIQP